MHKSVDAISIIAIDIGNTRIKISDGEQTISVKSALPLAPLVLTYMRRRPHHHIVISSVAAEIEAALIAQLAPRPCMSAAKLLKRSTAPLRSIMSNGTGKDRIFGCIGALESCAAPLVTIDCGTATTFNVVDAAQNFLGGYILPGLQTQAESLFNTTALPRVHLREIQPTGIRSTPQSTNDAINNGIILGTVGALRELIETTKRELRVRTLTIILTGGNAELVGGQLEKSYPLQHINDLVLRGIRVIMQEYLQRTAA